LKDDNGDSYYENQTTGATQWERPVEKEKDEQGEKEEEAAAVVVAGAVAVTGAVAEETAEAPTAAASGRPEFEGANSTESNISGCASADDDSSYDGEKDALTVKKKKAKAAKKEVVASMKPDQVCRDDEKVLDEEEEEDEGVEGIANDAGGMNMLEQPSMPLALGGRTIFSPNDFTAHYGRDSSECRKMSEFKAKLARNKNEFCGSSSKCSSFIDSFCSLVPAQGAGNYRYAVLPLPTLQCFVERIAHNPEDLKHVNSVATDTLANFWAQEEYVLLQLGNNTKASKELKNQLIGVTGTKEQVYELSRSTETDENRYFQNILRSSEAELLVHIARPYSGLLRRSFYLLHHAHSLYEPIVLFLTDVLVEIFSP